MYFIFGTCLAFHKTATRIDKAGTAVPILKMEKQRQQRLNDSLEIPRLGGMELGWKQGLWYYPFPFSLLLPVLKVKKKLSMGHSVQPQDSVTAGPGTRWPCWDRDPNTAQVRVTSFRRILPRRCFSFFQSYTPCTLASLPSKECSAGTQSSPCSTTTNWPEAKGGESLVLGSVSPDWERV